MIVVFRKKIKSQKSSPSDCGQKQDSPKEIGHEKKILRRIMMKFKATKRINPLNKDEAKYYAKAVYSEELTVLDLAEDISDACTLNVTDVEAVLTSLVRKLPVYLKNGFKIQLGSFGRVKLGLSSTGEENAEDVSAANITAKRIIFTPSPELKDEIEKVSFTKAV